jgi:hypothetical protein
VPICVRYQSQSVRAAFAASSPQQIKTLRAELFKQRQKFSR